MQNMMYILAAVEATLRRHDVLWRRHPRRWLRGPDHRRRPTRCRGGVTTRVQTRENAKLGGPAAALAVKDWRAEFIRFITKWRFEFVIVPDLDRISS